MIDIDSVRKSKNTSFSHDSQRDIYVKVFLCPLSGISCLNVKSKTLSEVITF